MNNIDILDRPQLNNIYIVSALPFLKNDMTIMQNGKLLYNGRPYNFTHYGDFNDGDTYMVSDDKIPIGWFQINFEEQHHDSSVTVSPEVKNVFEPWKSYWASWK